MSRHDTSYLLRAVDTEERALIVETALTRLKPVQHRFDAIAVRGYSGATIGAILAHALGKHLILVRKGTPHTDSHSAREAEGPLDWAPPARYLIVDDLTCSGQTIDEIKGAIGGRAAYVGDYLYVDDYLDLKVIPTEEAEGGVCPS